MTENKSGLRKVDPMIPETVKVKKIFWETEDVFTMELVHESEEKREFNFKPGQFNMLYAFGVGESAISISSDSSKKGSLHTKLGPYWQCPQKPRAHFIFLSSET